MTNANRKPDSKQRARRTTKRKPQARPPSTFAIMERLLSSPVPITISGAAARVPALEAIILQVMQKAMAGNARAFRMLADYQELASKRGSGPASLHFVENEYTREVARDPPRGD